MPQSFEPDLLEFSSLDLLDFNQVSLIWDYDSFILYEGEQEKTIKPIAEKWEDFWLKIKKLNAWGWQGEYKDNSTLDGETWSLHIIYNDNEINCSGSNKYPEGFKEFRKLLKLLIS